jgi:hypothetical protein
MFPDISGVILNMNNDKYNHTSVKDFSIFTTLQVNNPATLRSQVVLSSRLEGLRSRCRTLAEWMYFNPLRIW